MTLNSTAARRIAAALLASAALAGCGPGDQLIALQAENEQLRAQADTLLQQVNELRSALGESRTRVDDIRGNLRLGTYTRYGGNLSRDLDNLSARMADLEARTTEPDFVIPRPTSMACPQCTPKYRSSNELLNLV